MRLCHLATKGEIFIERKKLPECYRKENPEDFGEEGQTIQEQDIVACENVTQEMR